MATIERITWDSEHEADDSEQFDATIETYDELSAEAPRATNGGEVLVFRKDRGAIDGLTLYLDSIGKVDLLTAEQEVKLALQIQTGSQEAKQLMVEANLRLAVNIAKNYQDRGLPLLDLIQIGTLGLYRAAEKFDPDRGYKFSTYATGWIKKFIIQGLAWMSRTIRIPDKVDEKLYKINNIERKLTIELGREPVMAELAKEVEMDEYDLAELLMISSTPASLDEPIGEDQDSVFGSLLLDPDSPDPEASAIAAERKEVLDEILNCLPARWREILELKYGLNESEPQTLDELGKAYGISEERVSQIIRLALKKLKKMPEAQALRAVLDSDIDDYAS